MVFSSISFLFFFLPILLLVYYTVPKKNRNLVLLVFSLLFYYFGEKWYFLLLFASCVVNYFLGIIIDKTGKKHYLIIGILINLGTLIYFKYTNFFIDSFANVFNLNINFLNITLPLGISFFTFQNLSYLIDVYRKDVQIQKNFVFYATYITLFPQLIAGPIIRYKDVAEELKYRKESIDLFSEGVHRFVIGLAKKVLLADVLYTICDSVIASEMSKISYWLVALLYTLHIYYDFSGYSDMAIGLGKMFGFNFKENFNYPLWATSITDFWRKWHMSLSSFFKDYVYIPLGGSRCSIIKYVRNIFIVWLLTGLWHGASWNFVLWGVYFFIFLLLEKFVLSKVLKGGWLSRAYTFAIVLISFVIFKSTNINEIGNFLYKMVDFRESFMNQEVFFILKDNFIILLIAIIGSGPFINTLIKKIRKGKIEKLVEVLDVVFVIGLFIMSIAKILSGSFQPFIYFRF